MHRVSEFLSALMCIDSTRLIDQLMRSTARSRQPERVTQRLNALKKSTAEHSNKITFERLRDNVYLLHFADEHRELTCSDNRVACDCDVFQNHLSWICEHIHMFANWKASECKDNSYLACIQLGPTCHSDDDVWKTVACWASSASSQHELPLFLFDSLVPQVATSSSTPTSVAHPTARNPDASSDHMTPTARQAPLRQLKNAWKTELLQIITRLRNSIVACQDEPSASSVDQVTSSLRGSLQNVHTLLGTDNVRVRFPVGGLRYGFRHVAHAGRPKDPDHRTTAISRHKRQLIKDRAFDTVAAAREWNKSTKRIIENVLKDK